MKKILVAIDFSDVTDAVLEETYRQATVSKGLVELVHVAHHEPALVGFTGGPLMEMEYVSSSLDSERSKLEAFADQLRERGVDVTTKVVAGSTVEEIIKEVDAKHFDLIIGGCHGRGALFNLVVGSVTQSLLHEAKVPMLIVPAKDS